MHPIVAASVAAFSAQGVNHDGAAGNSGGRVEPDRAALELETPMDRMQRCAEGKLNFRKSGIEVNGGLLRVQRGVGGKENECRSGVAEESMANSRNRGGVGCHESYARKSFHPKSTISLTRTDEIGEVPA